MKRSPFVLASLLLLTLPVAAPAWSVSTVDTTQAGELPLKQKPSKSIKRKAASKKTTARKSAQQTTRPTVEMAAQTPQPAPSLATVPSVQLPVAIPALTLTTQLSQLQPARPVEVPPIPAGVPVAAQPIALPTPQPIDRPAVEPVAKPAAEPPARPVLAKYAGASQPAARNPYMAHPQEVNQPMKDMGKALGEFKLGLPSLSSLLPPMPTEGMSILPVIKTVYPTGEKPLVIVTFKCPTELVGITPLPTKALHDIVTWGMDSINSTNLLAFNMQQVCQ